MKQIFVLLFSVLFLFIFSCNKAGNSNAELNTQDDTLTPPSIKSETEGDKLINNNISDSSGGISLQGSAPGQNPDWNKKIIKTAFLKLEIKDFKIYTDIVHRTTKQYGGYIANEEQNQSEEKIESAISIKVPVEQFESIMTQLPASAEKILEKKITTDDVTGEMIDTKSRLQAKEQMRLKYLEFLKQAKNMEDVLKVQNEINAIQEDMESASGRINYLSHQSAYSTINLTFYQPLAGYNPGNENPGFATRLITAFKSGFHFIAEIFIGAISIWPLFLLASIGWIFLKRRRFALVAARQKL